MNFLKKAINQVQQELKVIQQKGKQTIEKIEQKIQEKVDSKHQYEKDVIQIIDRIYWMNFPTQDKIVGLSKYLNERFKQQYYIWNVSEHKYEVFPFNEQVADHNMPGYPNPSLQEIFMICKSVISWLNSDPENVAIIHCQNTRGRSALIISCLLCLNKTFNHPGEALTFFCKQTKTKDLKILFPSQQLYLNYFANILSGVKLNNKPLKLKKIIFSEVPKIMRKDEKGNEDISFRPYLQLFKDSQIIYNSLGQGRVASYSQNDLSLWFDLNGVEVYEDILFRCKHYHSNQLRYPIFRMLIHTGFTHDNVLRLLKTDIDFTSNVYVSDGFFIDLLFEEIGANKPNQNENKQQNNQIKDQEEEEKKTNLEIIVSECLRKLNNEQSQTNQQEEEDDEHDKEIQRILQKSTLASNIQEVPAASFSIGVPEFGSAEKQKKKNSEEEEEVIDDKKSDSHAEEAEDEDKLKSKEKVNKLLFDDIDEDQDLNHQEIDDYLDNLEKSDEEN
ncbi:PTEN tumor-suppressor protein C2 domain protein (macronuclear) [Tetrahymena thermophila SB210]|uniref:PTEN tumor-suppressor protein C2 domain protein n=1 Tax=Tetrahymena thermophila (strain SB210) TaxID=312017 RepID=I7MJK8_TETTS|nr:PTEN tumor-suppressor protein C2 domain protein [Tetrahymena thermophila SB210]EAS06714.2 PTEN tumor-suppressor protein C2 domain protein [Tetrahymena thermophila SB210]|eukprot:XP_001026956.2 PTEN tumor-suppressor protein C2 domain protein [Tetrahymena thermophila SB210]